MAYTSRNFKTKKALKEALAAGTPISVYQPNADLTGAQIPENGTVYLEGPPLPRSAYVVRESHNARRNRS